MTWQQGPKYRNTKQRMIILQNVVDEEVVAERFLTFSFPMAPGQNWGDFTSQTNSEAKAFVDQLNVSDPWVPD